MPTARRLRPAEQLIEPRVAALAEALECPVSDQPLLALARRMAAVIDAMPDAVAVSMLPNHSGPLIKTLAELEDRYRRRKRREPGTAPTRIQQLRVAHAAADAKRRGRS